MTPPVPQQDIIQMMKFIAGKAKNVESPLNITELGKQFKEESGSLISAESVEKRIVKHRHEIHKMDEFEMDTKVELMFALSAPIADEFLTELKKHAEVEVDDKSRIIRYKKTGGGLELNGRHSLSTMQSDKRSSELLQFLVEKSKTVNTPIADKSFLLEFKAVTGDVSTYDALSHRYRRLKKTIFQSSGLDKNTIIKMMFVSNAEVSDNILAELQSDAVVEVDKDGKITKYKAKDGSLELKGNHGISRTKKSFYANRWKKICQKVDESDEDDADDSRGRKDYIGNQVELVKFLIDKTKNVTFPTSHRNLAVEFKTEFDRSEARKSIEYQIRRIRERFPKMNQFDMHTKVKILFALSAPIDNDLLKDLRKDAIVELDENQRIKKYKANDGSLELEGDHSVATKIKTGKANNKNRRIRIVDDSSDSDEDEKEEDSKKRKITSNKALSSLSKKAKVTWVTKNEARVVDDSSDSDEDENKKNTRKRGRKSDQTVTSSSSVRRSQRIKNGMSGGRKRARYPYSSSESEVESPEEEDDDDDESTKRENDAPMDSVTSRVDNGGDDFDYDPPSYHQVSGDGIDYDTPIHNKENLDHAPREPNSEVSSDQNEEAGPSSLAKIETMSLLEFLTCLRPPTLQYTPTLVPKMDEKIKELEKKDQQISYNFIIESLESCIQILNTPNEMDPYENTISLSDFFYRLGMALLNIPHSSMDDFHIKMRKLATRGDKKVSLEHIRYAMQKTLDKIIR